LEVILNHEYEKSRFLNGAKIDESKLIFVPNEKKIEEIDVLPIGYVNKNNKKFHLLDKILSFDDIQNDIISFSTPCIIIGSAGSGKTALTLEKLKDLSGKILYTTLSPYLSENAALLYNSFDYENSHQEVSFLSFYEYVSTIEIPAGKEVDFRAFNNWIAGYKQAFKIKDSNKIYEEFKGVLTGSIIDKPYLSLTDYMSLGIKQSIFPEDEREKLYTLFEKYIIWLNDSNLFDSNIVSYNLLEKVEQDYDFVVIDEVQDITNIQLSLLLKSLKNPENFLLCGDSNQIVHPNFFSWAQVKSLFYKQEIQKGIIKVLATNYRNTPEVTKIANQLLLVKNARFGSIDKESSYLITSNSKHEGIVEFLENSTAVRTDLNTKTKNSIKFAILVLRTEDKSEAQRYFQSPLVFSIQEAKGLEYENIIYMI
jgi:superfamily I DNA/RNA helicase